MNDHNLTAGFACPGLSNAFNVEELPYSKPGSSQHDPGYLIIVRLEMKKAQTSRFCYRTSRRFVSLYVDQQRVCCHHRHCKGWAPPTTTLTSFEEDLRLDISIVGKSKVEYLPHVSAVPARAEGM